MGSIASSARLAACALALCACAQPPPPRPIDPGHNRPLSAQEHIEEAQRHEQEASAREATVHHHPGVYGPENRGGAPIECFDQPLAGIPYSGGKPLRIMRPCWSSHGSSTDGGDRHVETHRQAAKDHRSLAAGLVHAERNACAGLGEEEISHSPFYHREDIARVEPLLDRNGAVVGARVTFKQVEGLTAEWLERSVRCHLARAAVMGFSTTFMGYCPLMLPGVTTDVRPGPAGLIVSVRAKRDEVAAAVLGRARDLVDPSRSGQVERR